MSSKGRGRSRRNQQKAHTSTVLEIIAVVFLGAILLLLFNKPQSVPQAAVEEAAFNTLPQDIAEAVAEDLATPGYYEYEAGPNTYVLLTYGEVTDVAMNVTPRIDGTSVYFAVSSTKVTQPELMPVYRLFLTDATAISADETALMSPYYGVGSSGMNIGWVEETENNEYFVIPLKDTTPTDRVFKSNVDLRTNGLYYYEYSIQNAGAYITAAEKMDEYEVWVSVKSVEDTTANLMVGAQKITMTADITELDEDSVELLNQAINAEYNVKVTLKASSDKLSVASVKEINLESPEQTSSSSEPTK